MVRPGGSAFSSPVSSSRAPVPGNAPASAALTMMIAGRASSHIWARRAAGSDGSSGRYAPPDFSTASRHRIAAMPRAWQTPTRVSGPAPMSRRRWVS